MDQFSMRNPLVSYGLLYRWTKWNVFCILTSCDVGKPTLLCDIAKLVTIRYPLSRPSWSVSLIPTMGKTQQESSGCKFAPIVLHLLGSICPAISIYHHLSPTNKIGIRSSSWAPYIECRSGFDLALIVLFSPLISMDRLDRETWRFPKPCSA